MSNKTLVLYVFHEVNEAVVNFIENGIFHDEFVDFIFIINNLDLDIKVPHYVKVIKRENIGHDFGGWSDGLIRDNLYKKYKRFIFLNSTVFGPYLPMYYKGKWTDIFLEGLKNDVKLFGCSINCNKEHSPHVQSYCFSTDIECLDYLIDKGIFSKIYAQSRLEAILEKEVNMSKLIIENGWNIGCLMACYKNVDFRVNTTSIQTQLFGDMIYPESFGKSFFMSFYEIVFIKLNRNIQNNNGLFPQLQKFIGN
jgi:hypothetical protein